MDDMRSTIIPRSDQWNYDDFISGPITFKIEGVSVKSGQEQPVEISLAGTPKFYRPCKSMSRCLVAAWGPDSSKYVGRSITLYGDAKVKWAGLEVGGIRISHMSDITGDMTMALTVTRANKKPFTVRPLAQPKESAAAQSSLAADRAPETAAQTAPAADYITPDQCLTLEAACNDNGIKISTLKDKAKVERLARIRTDKYADAMAWIAAVIEAREKAKATKEVAV